MKRIITILLCVCICACRMNKKWDIRSMNVSKELQPQNASCSMLITLLGITMFGKEAIFLNALIPMLVTLLGIVLAEREAQHVNAPPAIRRVLSFTM